MQPEPPNAAVAASFNLNSLNRHHDLKYSGFREPRYHQTNEDPAIRLNSARRAIHCGKPLNQHFPHRNAFFSLHGETNHLYDPLPKRNNHFACVGE